MPTQTGPLAGIRILDAATFLAAPYAASLMSEYGAEVIKVEEPKGDWMRKIPPMRDGVSMWWKVIARNRQSVGIDLRTDDGRNVFKDLVAQSDVVIVKSGRVFWCSGAISISTTSAGSCRPTSTSRSSAT